MAMFRMPHRSRPSRIVSSARRGLSELFYEFYEHTALCGHIACIVEVKRWERTMGPNRFPLLHVVRRRSSLKDQKIEKVHTSGARKRLTGDDYIYGKLYFVICD
jgi:hypothetical protein